MLQRLYVHNFRCLENFELSIKEPSALLIGQNGTGKSTIRAALEILQKISRNVNRVGELIKSKDFTRGRSDLPIRFEIEILLNEKLYKYILALELPTNFTELKILEEQFSVAGIPVYSRKGAQVTVHYNSANKEAQFFVDWHLVALPLIQMQSETDPLHIFRTWLARAIILAPIPSIISGESDGETLNPEVNGSNFGNWFSGLLSRYPAAYTLVDKYLREVMPDIVDFHNEFIGKDSKNMLIRFQEKSTSLSVNFKALSDGEKCYFLCAAVLAANKFYGPLFCFWDEPDNYLSI